MIAQDIKFIVDHNLDKEHELLKFMATHWEELYHVKASEERITHFDVGKIYQDLVNDSLNHAKNKFRKLQEKEFHYTRIPISIVYDRNRISISAKHLQLKLVARNEREGHPYWENNVSLILYDYHDDTTQVTVSWNLSEYRQDDVSRLLTAIIQDDRQLSEEVLYLALRLEEYHREQNRLMLEKWTLWAKKEYGESYDFLLYMIQRSYNPPEEVKLELDEEEDDPDWGVFVENDIYEIPEMSLPGKNEGTFPDRPGIESNLLKEINDPDEDDIEDDEYEDDADCQEDEYEGNEDDKEVFDLYEDAETEDWDWTSSGATRNQDGGTVMSSDRTLTEKEDLKKKQRQQHRKVRRQNSPFIETLQESNLHAYIYSDEQRSFILNLISQGYFPFFTYWGKGKTTRKHWNAEPYLGRHGEGFRLLTTPRYKHSLIHVTYFIKKGKGRKKREKV